MTDLTPAEARRLAIDGVEPYRVIGTALVAGIEIRVLTYPPPVSPPTRPHPDDAEKLARIRAAVKAQVTVADVKDAGG